MPKNAEINHIILGSVVLRISDIRLQFAAQKTDNQKGIQHNWVYVVSFTLLIIYFIIFISKKQCHFDEKYGVFEIFFWK